MLTFLLSEKFKPANPIFKSVNSDPTDVDMTFHYFLPNISINLEVLVEKRCERGFYCKSL